MLRKIESIILGLSMFACLFCLGIASVYAKTTVTTTLDLTNHDTEDKLSEEGWSWDQETKTLKLEDATFERTDTDTISPCIKFSKADDITVIFEGTNNLTADKDAVFYGSGTGTGSLTFKSTNNGTLNLKIKTFSSVGGTINSEGGILANGVVTISGGNLKINTQDFPKTKGLYALRQINITGGNIDIKASAASIMVTGVPNGTDYEDGIVISGENITLNTSDERNPAIHAGSLQHKNIVINGGNITLNSDFGIYTANGVISVNHLDGFNADNVQFDVFKVAEAEGNEIKINDADYDKVDEAIARANKLNRDDYEDFKAVDDAIKAVVRGKSALEQAQVDAMAESINQAIGNLKLKIVTEEPNTPEQNEENPNTSDNILSIIVLGFFGLAGLTGCGLYLKKDFNN